FPPAGRRGSLLAGVPAGGAAGPARTSPVLGGRERRDAGAGRRAAPAPLARSPLQDAGPPRSPLLLRGDGAFRPTLCPRHRGAEAATLVDEDKNACAVALRNAESLGYGEKCKVIREDVFRALPRLPGPYDLVFSDPPYAARATQPILELLAKNALLAEGGR